MAKVIPYACATAHGKINESITLKRHNCKVYLMKTPKPRRTNTAAQQTGRDKLRDAVLRYQLRNSSEKIFLDKRSRQIPGDQYSLWISKYMKDRIWSRNKPVGVTTIENMVIQDPIGSEVENAKISIEAVLVDLEDIGCIFHNTLGSDDEVENSSRGPDGIITGVMEYKAAKFGYGVYNYTSSNYIMFPSVHTFNKAIIDHWWIPDFSSTDVDFQTADLFHIYSLPSPDTFQILWRAYSGPMQKTFVMYGYEGGSRCRYYFTPVPFVADEKIHLEFIINYKNPPGSRYRMKQNGVELSTALINFDNELQYGPDEFVIVAFWNEAESKSIVDNLKVYPADTYADQVAANREFEYFSPDPIPIDTYGYVYDNSNIFSWNKDIEDAPAQRIVIENIGGYDLQIPFRYFIAVTWSGPGVSSRTSLIRFPEMTIPTGQTAYLYLSQDWSTYYDKTLRDLACTNKM